MDMPARAKLHTLMSSALLAVGAMLMAMMIVVESEPGALPLLMIVAGSAWLAAARLRLRRARRGRDIR